MLNFWASWCEPCRAESPLLQRWHERISSARPGTVLGVDMLDVTSDARDFVREYGLTYPMLHDKRRLAGPRLGASGPTRDVRHRPPRTDRGLRRGPWTTSSCGKGPAARPGALREAALVRRCAALALALPRPGWRPVPQDDPRRRGGRGDVPGVRHAAGARHRGAAGPARAGADPPAGGRVPLEGGGQGRAGREFGDEVLAVPGDDGFDLAAYLVPGLALLLGRRRCRGRGAAMAAHARAEDQPEPDRGAGRGPRAVPATSGSSPTSSATTCDAR